MPAALTREHVGRGLKELLQLAGSRRCAADYLCFAFVSLMSLGTLMAAVMYPVKTGTASRATCPRVLLAPKPQRRSLSDIRGAPAVFERLHGVLRSADQESLQRFGSTGQPRAMAVLRLCAAGGLTRR